jgi:hypothetical protein
VNPADTGWSDAELHAVGHAVELSPPPDGRQDPGAFVTMWAGRVGKQLFVRSAYGPDNHWFRRATAAGAGRVRAGGVTRDVPFESAEPTG